MGLNYSSKITNVAVGALAAQQAVIANTGNNVANVNTPGYSRRVVNLESRSGGNASGGLDLGSGVKVASLTRIVDEFLSAEVRKAQSEKASTSIEADYIARAEQFFDLSGARPTIGSALNSFFSSISDLAVNPASIELRSVALSKAEDLVNTIKDTYNGIANLQTEIESRLSIEVDAVNTLTTQIATLNGRISQQEGSGQVAATDRDQRDLLLEKLSEKISVNVLEVSDGTVSVSLNTGLNLVSGSNSRNLEVSTSPSFGGPTYPPTLGGGTKAFIVYNYGTATSRADIDLSSSIGADNGVLGGLLRVSGIADSSDTSAFDAVGFLPELAARIESITRVLLQDFNEAYLGPDEDTGDAFLDPSSGDLDGQAPTAANVASSPYAFFDFSFSGTKDNDGGGADGVPDDIGNHTGIDNYSSLLQLAISDPRDIAAARDLDSVANTLSFVPGDNSNLLALLNLQNTSFTFSAGSFSQTGTFEEVFNTTLAFVGNEASQANTKRDIADAAFLSSAGRRDEVSAVSLDEEFTNLIRFQKAFEASARMIQTADEMLERIINLI